MGGFEEPPPNHAPVCASEYSLSQRVVLRSGTEVEGFDEADGKDAKVLLPAGTVGVVRCVYGMGVAAFYDAIFMLPDSSEACPKLMVARVELAVWPRACGLAHRVGGGASRLRPMLAA